MNNLKRGVVFERFGNKYVVELVQDGKVRFSHVDDIYDVYEIHESWLQSVVIIDGN